jgi:mannosyl-oligosaccharide glucosidase
MAVTSLISRLNAAQETALLNSQLGITPPFSPPGTTTPSSSRYLDSPPLALSYLRSIYPALRRHYLWFRRTQTAKHLLKPYDRSPPSRQEAYRWRGRTEHHVLTSGLDDYPRAVPPSEGELHVDLHSWMGFFARTMGEVAEFLGEEEDLEEYKRNEKNILANLDGQSGVFFRVEPPLRKVR